MARIKITRFSMGHLVLLNLYTTPPAGAPLPLPSPPTAAPSPYMWTVSSRWLGILGTGHPHAYLWLAGPLHIAVCSLCLWCPPYSAWLLRCRSGFRWHLWETFAEPSSQTSAPASPVRAHPHPGESLASLTAFSAGLEAPGGHGLSSLLDLATE